MGVQRGLGLALCGGVLATMTAAAPAAVILDDFNSTGHTWPFSLPPSASSVGTSDLGVTGVITGNRFLTLQYADYPNPSAGLIPTLVAVSTTAAGQGVLDFATPSDRTATLDLYYFPPTAALTAMSSLSVSVLQYDGPANLPMSVTLLLNGTAYTPAATVLPGGPATLTFDTSAVPAPVKAGIVSLDVIFAPATGGDFRLDEITATVPEPAGLTAGLFAAAGLALTRRRATAPQA